MGQATQHIGSWPEESREAAQLVIDAHGEPDEVTDTQLVWLNAHPWKRLIATRRFYRHDFPAPHIDAVESVIDYRVPPEKFAELAAFDGSVVAERTADEARAYYAKEFADYRRKLPTPYMEKLRFVPGRDTADPDMRMLSDEDLARAKKEGEKKAG
jgi:hypothetical protein